MYKSKPFTLETAAKKFMDAVVAELGKKVSHYHLFTEVVRDPNSWSPQYLVIVKTRGKAHMGRPLFEFLTGFEAGYRKWREG